MGDAPTVFTKTPGGKLYFRLKDAAGKWRNEPTPYKAGQEADAIRYAAAARRAVERKRSAATSEGAPTVAEYAARWLEERGKRGLASIADDVGRINNHVLPTLGSMLMRDVRPRHIRDMVRAFRAAGELAPRTIAHVYGIAHTMFRDAIIDEVIETNPCMLKRGELPAKVDADPEWRSLATFEPGEVRALVTSEQLPPERRVQYALKSLAGLRHGEAAGLRWRHYDAGAGPLGRLTVATSYDTGRTKTNVTRLVPVHPALAAILERWRELWADVYGDAPGPEDYIVPTRNRTPVDPTDAGRAFKVDLRTLGLRVDAGELRDRGGHDLRAWFISTAQEHGAPRDVIAEITHTKRRDVVTGYTRMPWATFCAAVERIPFEPGADPVPVCSSFAPTQAKLRNRYENKRPRRDSKPQPGDTEDARGRSSSSRNVVTLERAALDSLREGASLLRLLAGAVLAGDEVGARRYALQVPLEGPAPGAGLRRAGGRRVRMSP